MEKINIESIADFYNQRYISKQNPWGTDYFNVKTEEYLDNHVTRFLKRNKNLKMILNAGSGGKTYTDIPGTMYHVDVSEAALEGIEHSYVCSIENMPFEDNTFDCIICVGSVLNYADLSSVISKFNHITTPEALLVLEYERIQSGFVDEEMRSKDISLRKYLFDEEEHECFLYSDKYVEEALTANNFVITKKVPFTSAVPWASRFMKYDNAKKLFGIEPVLRLFPFIAEYSHNEFLICKKKK